MWLKAVGSFVIFLFVVGLVAAPGLEQKHRSRPARLAFLLTFAFGAAWGARTLPGR